MAKPPLSGFWAALIQPVRPPAQHQLPRSVAEPHAQVCTTALHSVAVPEHTRAQHHPLRPQAREHSPVQPQALCDQNRGLWELLPIGPEDLPVHTIKVLQVSVIANWHDNEHNFMFFYSEYFLPGVFVFTSVYLCIITYWLWQLCALLSQKLKNLFFSNLFHRHCAPPLTHHQLPCAPHTYLFEHWCSMIYIN